MLTLSKTVVRAVAKVIRDSKKISKIIRSHKSVISKEVLNNKETTIPARNRKGVILAPDLVPNNNSKEIIPTLNRKAVTPDPNSNKETVPIHNPKEAILAPDLVPNNNSKETTIPALNLKAVTPVPNSNKEAILNNSNKEINLAHNHKADTLVLKVVILEAEPQKQIMVEATKAETTMVLLPPMATLPNVTVKVSNQFKATARNFSGVWVMDKVVTKDMTSSAVKVQFGILKPQRATTHGQCKDKTSIAAKRAVLPQVLITPDPHQELKHKPLHRRLSRHPMKINFLLRRHKQALHFQIIPNHLRVLRHLQVVAQPQAKAHLTMRTLLQLQQ